LSFVVPAHDEAALIGGTLRTLRAAADAAGEPYEVIVVDDASTDRTAAIAAAAGARVVTVNLRNIGAVRNAGARAARGDTLVFVDADTSITAAAVRGVIDARRGGAIGGGTRIQFDGPLPRWAAVYARVVLWLLMRMRWAAGCFLFASRDAFAAAGGFDERLFATEEIALSRALKRQGRVVMLPQVVRTSARKIRTYSGWEILRLSVRFGLRPWLVRRREELELWYGPRRPDAAGEKEATDGQRPIDRGGATNAGSPRSDGRDSDAVGATRPGP
jgi:glycosyltransferase involved in cell wall biosynthesis